MAGRKETTFTSALWAWPSTCFLSACNVVLGRQAAQVKRVHSTPNTLQATRRALSLEARQLSVLALSVVLLWGLGPVAA